MRYLILFFTVVVLSSCAGSGVKQSPFAKQLIEQHLELQKLITLDELRASSTAKSILNLDDIIEVYEVNIRGSGDSQFVRGRHLLKACGPTCTPDSGLGEILSDFVVRKELNNHN